MITLRQRATGVMITAAALTSNSYANDDLDKEYVGTPTADYQLKVKKTSLEETSYLYYLNREFKNEGERLRPRYFKARAHVNEVQAERTSLKGIIPEEQELGEKYDGFKDFIEDGFKDSLGDYLQDHETIGPIINRIESWFTFGIDRKPKNGKNGSTEFGEIAESEERLNRENKTSFYLENIPFFPDLLGDPDFKTSIEVISIENGEVNFGGNLKARVRYMELFGSEKLRIDRVSASYDVFGNQDSSITLQKLLNKPIEFTRIVSWAKKTTRKEYKQVGRPKMLQLSISMGETERERQETLFQKDDYNIRYIVSEKSSSDNNWQLFFGTGNKNIIFAGFKGNL